MKMTLQKLIYSYISLSLILFVIFSCARIGAPTGGPVDKDPPKVLESKPLANSTHFTDDKIEIEFDEYVQLKDIYTEMVVSPPLAEKPFVKTKDKSIVVELKSDLDSNTTYTISFGDAIVDNNEGNALPDYSFAFSTGDYLDSMAVTGNIINAKDLSKLKEPVFVGLYQNLNDSIPLNEPPTYVGRTNKEGVFEIKNVKPDKYRIFALSDANANLTYDMPEENIAFTDSVIQLFASEIPTDTYVVEDTALYNKLSDSLAIDSTLNIDSLMLASNATRKIYGYHINMRMFNENNRTQYLKDYKRTTRYKLDFAFNATIDDFFEIHPLNIENSRSNWALEEYSTNKDSLTVWLNDSVLYNSDSLMFNVRYHVKDTLNKTVIKSDTLPFNVKIEKPKGRRSKDDKEAEVETDSVRIPLKLDLNAKSSGKFDLNKDLVITTETPVFNWNTQKVQLSVLEDTLFIPLEFSIIKDTSEYNRFIIKTRPLEEIMTYKLILLDSAFTDIYGFYNDTTEFRFTTQREDYYGILRVNVKNISAPAIIQLLSSSDQVVQTRIIKQDELLQFEYLSAKEYKLRAIIDENENGKWDTGNYLQKKQPEKIINYEQAINVRSNWEIEQTWDLNY